jgi:hypothetical protein
MVMDQMGKYDQVDGHGRLYGTIIASVGDYMENKKGKYVEYHRAFCAHYVDDLSQPLQQEVSQGGGRVRE